MARLFDGEVDVAYYQFYVETPGVIPGEDVERRAAGQVNGLCRARETGMLQCTTGLHTGPVPVAIDLLDAAPELDTDWEEIVEVSLTTTTPTVLLYDWDHQHPVELALGEGSLRVRYHAHGMQPGHDADVRMPDAPVLDRYLLQCWPADPAPDAVLRQTSAIAAYWHDTARNTPDPATVEAEDMSVDEYRAVLQALIYDITTGGPDLPRVAARWLAHHAVDVAGPETAAWARPALDALDRGLPLSAPFDDRQATIAAVHRDLATPDSGHDQAPDRRVFAVLTVLAAAEPDPGMAFMTALGSAQFTDPRPEPDLLADVRARFLA